MHVYMVSRYYFISACWLNRLLCFYFPTAVLVVENLVLPVALKNVHPKLIVTMWQKFSEEESEPVVETKPDIITPSVIDIPDSKSDISSSSAQPQLTSVDIRVIITGTPFDFRVRVASLEMHAA